MVVSSMGYFSPSHLTAVQVAVSRGKLILIPINIGMTITGGC